MKLALSIFVFFSLLATATAGTKSTLADFEKVKMGMEKTEVLALLHSPYSSRRWRGQDRWMFHFYEQKDGIVVKIKKELLFKAGTVSYKGDPLKAKVSAEEQDKINLAADLKDLEDWKKHKKKAVDARREYKEWVQQVHNKDPDPEITVPRFKPIK